MFDRAREFQRDYGEFLEGVAESQQIQEQIKARRDAIPKAYIPVPDEERRPPKHSYWEDRFWRKEEWRSSVTPGPVVVPTDMRHMTPLPTITVPEPIVIPDAPPIIVVPPPKIEGLPPVNISIVINHPNLINEGQQQEVTEEVTTPLTDWVDDLFKGGRNVRMPQ